MMTKHHESKFSRITDRNKLAVKHQIISDQNEKNGTLLKLCSAVDHLIKYLYSSAVFPCKLFPSDHDMICYVGKYHFSFSFSLE